MKQNKISKKKSLGKLLQVSKEYYRGMWQHVGFYKQRDGGVIVRAIRD